MAALDVLAHLGEDVVLVEVERVLLRAQRAVAADIALVLDFLAFAVAALDEEEGLVDAGGQRLFDAPALVLGIEAALGDAAELPAILQDL